MMMPSVWRRDLFDELFDGIAKPMPYFKGIERGPAQQLAMRTDVIENEDAFELDIDLPGVKKEDVKAELKNGYLVISASRDSNEEKSEEGKYIRRERYFGSASRSFYVGDQLQQEDIKAKFENGILKLTVPKNVEHPELEANKYIAIEG